MALFFYHAKKASGETVSGEQEAKTEADLAHALKKENLYLVFAYPKGAKHGAAFSSIIFSQLLAGFRSVPLSERMMFSRNLALMLDAGVPLTRSLTTLAEQTNNASLRKALQGVEETVRRGDPFSQALKQYPGIFGDFYASMVAVAENSGTLSDTLRLLADQLKKEHDLRAHIKGALMYPAVIITAMLIIGVLMMILVVPTFEQVFKDVHVELPPTTRLIFATAGILSSYWWAVLILLPLVIFSLRALFKSSAGKNGFDWFMLHAPMLGKLSKEVYTAQFARTLASLIKGGVAIVDALRITSDTLGNHYYKNSLGDAQKMVIKGETLHEALGWYASLYPPILVQMISVGEETGKLSEMLDRLASFYEEEVATATQNLSSLVEPVLMIFIGSMVGFFAISVIQPMYSFIGKI